MSHTEQSPVVWSPSEDTVKNSRMGQFKAWLGQQGFGPFADYHALHQWSIDELETFWQKVWDYCGLVCDTPADRVLKRLRRWRLDFIMIFSVRTFITKVRK